MVFFHNIDGYDNFIDFFKKVGTEEKSYVVYFSGTKDEDTGESWCDDCQRAWPVINTVLQNASDNLNFVYVEVGNRAIWKDPNCPFRKNPACKLLVLPTLLRWKSHKRLEGGQCEKEELIKMLFEEEEEEDIDD